MQMSCSSEVLSTAPLEKEAIMLTTLSISSISIIC